jgi:hypothetical protein
MEFLGIEFRAHVLFEFFIMALLLVAALLLPRDKLKQWVRRKRLASADFFRNPRNTLLAIALLAFAGSAAVAVFVFFPAPRIHDEFSYLLASDTYAHGRLANPTHPFWKHFESFHIIHQPVYTSKYPFGQGLMLAVGQFLGGSPAVGLWLLSALGCASLYWMFLGWLPRRWAIIGAWIVVVRFGICGYWSQSYWGGMLSATAGALVFGALPRICAQPSISRAVILGLGLSLFAITRPYEGVLASLPAMAVLIFHIFSKKGFGWKTAITHVLIPLLIPVVLALTSMGFYNYKLTANSLRMPYQVSRSTYGGGSLFRWKPAQPAAHYNHREIRTFYETRAHELNQQMHSVRKWFEASIEKLAQCFIFYLGIALSISLVYFRAILRNNWMRFAFLTCSLLMLNFLFLQIPFSVHYAAPITGLVLVLSLQGMRFLNLWKHNDKPIGRFLVRCIPWVCTLSLLANIFIYGNSAKYWWSAQRAQILSVLERSPDKHLIFVRYSATHDTHNEWVYNRADIDGAKVVWAREMSPAENQQLIKYFQGRKIWILEADAAQKDLQLYPVRTSTPAE